MTTDPSSGFTEQWNSRNQLVESSTTSFTYDDFGRRVNVNGINPALFDGINLVQVLPADVTSNVLEGLNLDDFFAWTDTSGTVALLPDGLPGSTLGVVNSSGSISTTYSYQ